MLSALLLPLYLFIYYKSHGPILIHRFFYGDSEMTTVLHSLEVEPLLNEIKALMI